MIKFHILSDIHLEYYDHNHPKLTDFIQDPSEASYLCLCGDIGNPYQLSYAKFLSECITAGYKYIFVILGNHEYYGTLCMDETVACVEWITSTLNKKFKCDKLVFLNNSSFDIPNTGYRVYGTTLWTRILPSQSGSLRLKDFQHIPDISDYVGYNAKHKNCMSALLTKVKQTYIDGKQLIVLSHHPPSSYCGNSIYNLSNTGSAYKNNLEDYIINHTDVIAAWFYGHDHFSLKMKIGKTVVASYQPGYPVKTNIPSACKRPIELES